jgi:hypothetical protein
VKIAFEIYGRRPLGKLLGEILDALAKHPATAPREIGLFSRSGRVDIPRADILASAERSATDTCTVAAASGEITVRWMYGPRASAQSLIGRISVEPQHCSSLKELLAELCVITGAIYACCDLEATIDADSRFVGGMLFREQAFVGVYWFNYFGREYREALKVDEAIHHHATEVRELGEGLCLTLGATPEEREEASAKGIAEHWPVFQRYRPGTKFANAVAIDYGEIRGLEKPRSAVTTIGSTVGAADDFIASVHIYAQQFHEWARTKGLSPKTEGDFQKIFQEHEPFIRDELLVPAIAAYGETVKAKMGGVWRKAELFHRGEPVVARPGRPWTARRVILEVLEGLEPVET